MYGREWELAINTVPMYEQTDITDQELVETAVFLQELGNIIENAGCIVRLQQVAPRDLELIKRSLDTLADQIGHTWLEDYEPAECDEDAAAEEMVRRLG